MTLSARFRKIIDAPSCTEREVHAFLKNYPMLMIRLFNVSCNYYIAIPEFPLGTDYRADYLVLSADSGYWHAVFVEFKGPRDRLYLKDGSPSKPLRTAQKQVADWSHMFRVGLDQIRRDIAKYLKPRQIPAQNTLMGKGVRADEEILHPDTYLEPQFKIVMGRRASFADEPRHHRPSPGAGYYLQVSTYDRVYDCLLDEEDLYGSSAERILSCRDAREIASHTSLRNSTCME